MGNGGRERESAVARAQRAAADSAAVGTGARQWGQRDGWPWGRERGSEGGREVAAAAAVVVAVAMALRRGWGQTAAADSELGGREGKGEPAEGVEGRQMTCTQTASSQHADGVQTASKSVGRWWRRQEAQWCMGGGCADPV